MAPWVIRCCLLPQIVNTNPPLQLGTILVTTSSWTITAYALPSELLCCVFLWYRHVPRLGKETFFSLSMVEPDYRQAPCYPKQLIKWSYHWLSSQIVPFSQIGCFFTHEEEWSSSQTCKYYQRYIKHIGCWGVFLGKGQCQRGPQLHTTPLLPSRSSVIIHNLIGMDQGWHTLA